MTGRLRSWWRGVPGWVGRRVDYACRYDLGSDDEFDQRKQGESFCGDCPDHEACMTGYPCYLVKRVHR